MLGIVKIWSFPLTTFNSFSGHFRRTFIWWFRADLKLLRRLYWFHEGFEIGNHLMLDFDRRDGLYTKIYGAKYRKSALKHYSRPISYKVEKSLSKIHVGFLNLLCLFENSSDISPESSKTCTIYTCILGVSHYLIQILSWGVDCRIFHSEKMFNCNQIDRRLETIYR